MTKSAWPSPVQAGDLLTYTIAYTVTGDEPVYGVTVSDTVPVNTTFVTATLPHILIGDTVVWPLGDFLPPASGITQATGILTLVVQVDSPLVSGTVIYNAVAITDTSGLTDTDDITTPVQSSHTLSVTKSASPSPVQAGGVADLHHRLGHLRQRAGLRGDGLGHSAAEHDFCFLHRRPLLR